MMKKRIVSLMMVLCMVVSLLPTTAFAEGCTCQSPCTAERKNEDCPVCGREDSGVEDCGKYAAEPKSEETAQSEATAAPTPAQQVQGLIDALLDAETITEENRQTVENQLTAIDEAKLALSAEQRSALNFTKYNAAIAAVNVLYCQPAAEKPQTVPEGSKSAVGSLQDAISKATKGEMVTLTGDVTLTKPLEISAGIILDLAGYNIRLSGDMKAAFNLSTATITITNSSEKVGTVYGNNDIEADDWKTGGEGTGEIGVYAVTFQVEGKTIATQYVKKPNKAVELEAPQKDGYTFKEWQKKKTTANIDDKTGDVSTTITYGTYDFNSDVIGDITLVAEYTPITYSIVFNANGGTGKYAYQTLTYGNYGTLSKNTYTREGYTFTGWNTAKDGTGTKYDDGATVKNLTTTADDEITLFAQWKSNTPAPAITFDANGGALTGDASATTKDGKLESLPTDPTRTGYAFAGWYTEKTGGDKVTTDTVFEKNATIYAHWAAILYAIEFDSNGGKGRAMADMTLYYDQSQGLTANTFTREGYRFAGWNTQADGMGTKYKDKETVINLTTDASETVTLYAQWELIEVPTYTITFDPNGGTVATDKATTTDGKLSELPTPTRTGYTFDGWYTSKDGGTVVTKKTVYSADTTIFARWTANTYAIEFEANGGTGKAMTAMTLYYDQPKNLTANTFTRDGYQFAGWNTQADGEGTEYADGQEVINLTTGAGETVTLYAQWEKTDAKPVTRLDFSLGGYGYKKPFINITVTPGSNNQGVTFGDEYSGYGDHYGIVKNSKSLLASSYGVFQEETDYFLFVTVREAEGYTLRELKAENVFLDGSPALHLVSKDKEMTAVFALKTIYLIKATAGSNGQIDPEGTLAVFEGDSVTFTITPNNGYVRSTLKVDGEKTKVSKTYTFEDIQESHTLYATFKKDSGNPKTGDDSGVQWAYHAMTIAAGALAALLILRKKRNR